MAEKAITIYTPSDMPPHITAEDDAFIYNSILGGKSGILGNLSCTASGGSVVLRGGGVSNCGYILRIPDGQSVTLNSANLAQGMMRIDTVVSQFTRGGGTTADSHTFALIKGEASTSPEPPALIQSSLQNNGDVNQIALYYIVLFENQVTDIIQAADNLPQSGETRRIYVQQTAPASPNEGDLWFW